MPRLLLDVVFGVADIRKASWGGLPLYRDPLYFIPRGADYPEDKGSVFFEQIAEETFVTEKRCPLISRRYGWLPITPNTRSNL